MEWYKITSPVPSDFIGSSASQWSSSKSDVCHDVHTFAKPPDLISSSTYIGNIPVMYGPIIKPEVDRSYTTSAMLASRNVLGTTHNTISRTHSPLRLLPDTSLHKYSSQDEDSGISNSLNNSSRWKSTSTSNLSTSMNYPNTKPHGLSNNHYEHSSFSSPVKSYDLNKSFDFNHSDGTRRAGYAKSVSSFDPNDKYSSNKYSNSARLQSNLDKGKSRSVSLELQGQLDDSEKRRQLLVEKLNDAKDTIKFQSDRLDNAESGVRSSNFTLEDYRLRERRLRHLVEEDNVTKALDTMFFSSRPFHTNPKEYKKKIAGLEKEKEDYQSRRLDSLKQREELQERLGGLENELGMLKTSYTLVDSENKRREDVIMQKQNSLVSLEEENMKLLKSKDSLSKETTAMKESLEIARNRNEWLENQTQDNKTELISLRQENRSLSGENRTLHTQVSEIRETNLTLKQENSTHMSALKTLHQEKLNLQRQMDSFYDSVADLKANLASITSDKERYFQEKLDLHQKLQNTILERETAIKEKSALEERVNEVNAELAQASLFTDKEKQDSRRMEEELSAVKKVSEVLSLELASTKANLEKALERRESLTQTNKIALQQHSLYEQEIKSLEKQLESMRQTMESIKDGHTKEREGLDSNTIKLREELRSVKSERNQLELKAHELTARKNQSEQALKQESAAQLQDLETWRNNCEKMTASLSRKEMEVQQLSKKLSDIEDQTGYLKMNQQTYQAQYEELVEAKEEVARLDRENRRLLQERSENQQVIQLLEMQKNILAKTSEVNQSKSADATPDQNTCQLRSEVEILSSENQAYQIKIHQLEQIRDELIQEKEERLRGGELYFPTRNTSQNADSAISSTSNKELEKQNKQLRDVNSMLTEQLNRVEKDNSQLRVNENDSANRLVLRRVEVEKENLEEENTHLKRQYQHLEKMYHKTSEDLNTQTGETSDLVSLQTENEVLKTKVQDFEIQSMTKSNEVRSLKNEKKQLEEERESFQKQLADVNKQLFECSHDQTKQVVGLQKQVAQLNSELDDCKVIQNKQDNLITSLKDQSLDDVGSELNVMRKELNKLMGVIKTKDMEIENLGSELETTKKKVSHRDKVIDELRTSSDYERAGWHPSLLQQSYEQAEYSFSSREQDKDELLDKLGDMEKEYKEIENELEAARTDMANKEKELAEFKQQLKDIETEKEDELNKMADKLRRELANKDRQIESLEEQLRRNTSAELRRLKREASKVEVLKQENRHLVNQISQGKGKNAVPKTGSTTEDHDSWDSDSISHDHNHQGGATTTMTRVGGRSLSEELEEAEKNALKELAEDEDVRNVVAMLENVELNDTFPLSTYNTGERTVKTEVVLSGDEEDVSSGQNTPRNYSAGDDMDEFGTEGYNGNRSPMYNGSDLSDEGRNSRKPPPSKRRGSGSRFRKEEDEGMYPSPTLASDTPKRSSSANYKLTSADQENGYRKSRSRSPRDESPVNTYERSRSYERSSRSANINHDSYETRSRSYDRRGPGRSVSNDATTTGYGSLSSSIGLRNSFGVNNDLNSKSLPDSGGPRYRSSLEGLGPNPNETKAERRKRMRELLRTLDKPAQRF